VVDGGLFDDSAARRGRLRRTPDVTERTPPPPMERPMTAQPPMLLANLVDPTIRLAFRATKPRPTLHHVDPTETRDVAEAFIAARSTADPLVALAYRELEMQTDRQYTALTDPSGPYRLTVASTGQVTPYTDAEELIASVLTTRTLEVTTSAADRAHPLLEGAVGGAYYRFRAVHDLVGHIATGFGFDEDGEYSAWLVQRTSYTGLARWAARTELHAEISVLWVTGQCADHKAVLLDRDEAKVGAPTAPGTSGPSRPRTHPPSSSCPSYR
jgi:hypothetical protein